MRFSFILITPASAILNLNSKFLPQQRRAAVFLVHCMCVSKRKRLLPSERRADHFRTERVQKNTASCLNRANGAVSGFLAGFSTCNNFPSDAACRRRRVR